MDDKEINRKLLIEALEEIQMPQIQAIEILMGQINALSSYIAETVGYPDELAGRMEKYESFHQFLQIYAKFSEKIKQWGQEGTKTDL